MSKGIILLADDDRDDSEMFAEALADIDPHTVCYTTTNGLELLEILKQLTTPPRYIFLDLNMPMMNGFRCLAALKADDKYKDIPVIIISTSSHQDEIDTAGKLGALCYFVKPSNFNKLKDVLKVMLDRKDNHSTSLADSIKAVDSRYVFPCFSE